MNSLPVNSASALAETPRCQSVSAAPSWSGSPSRVFRIKHQLAHEWRAQWGLVLVWMLLLASQWWHTLKVRAWDLPVPDSLPGLLALLIIVRSIRADAPGNAEMASHTRPVGRDALWAGKAMFFMLALLLPWIARGVLDGLGMGFGAREWLGLVLARVLPALVSGGLVAVCAALSDSSRKGVICGVAGLALLIGMLFLREAMSLEESKRCAWVVAAVVWSFTMLLAWCLITQRKDASVLLTGGVLLTAVALLFWRYDWRARPERTFADAKLVLQVGERPDAAAQELWPGLFVTGLPPDHVASVVEFADVSDYHWGEKKNRREHWMTQAHTQTLMAHYPAGSLWHGNVDMDMRDPLKKHVKTAEAGSWKLKLAVQHMQRVVSMPMNAVRSETVLLEMRRRLNFGVWKRSVDNQISFWANLHRRLPLLLPRTDMEDLRVNEVKPEENFLVLLHSPELREVRTACEADERYPIRNEILWQQARRPVSFAFTHPRPQMDIAGLTLDDWLAGSTLDLWWPEECGVVELEISAEQLQQLLDRSR